MILIQGPSEKVEQGCSQIVLSNRTLGTYAISESPNMVATSYRGGYGELGIWPAYFKSPFYRREKGSSKRIMDLLGSTAPKHNGFQPSLPPSKALTAFSSFPSRRLCKALENGSSLPGLLLTALGLAEELALGMTSSRVQGKSKANTWGTQVVNWRARR